MLITPASGPTIVAASSASEEMNTNNNENDNQRPDTHVAYLMPGTLRSSVIIAADLKSTSTLAGHYTEFPSHNEPTILVQIPFEGDEAPGHVILHDGPCI